MRMGQRETLRSSILDKPFDNSRRLKYADWLEANGNRPWAELIRAQVEWAELPPFALQQVRYAVYDTCRWKLAKKQRDLLARHEKEWLGPLADAVTGWTWDRGFLTLTLSIDQLMAKPFEEAA